MGEPGFYWFEGDYLRDTAHLSNDEDLAYRRLLGAYYAKGQPLPASIDRLQNIARVPIEAVKAVADEFLPIGADGLRHNKKADKEIARRNAWLADQARKAKLGGAARWSQDARGDARGDANGQVPGMPGRCPDDALPSPSPSPLPKPSSKPKKHSVGSSPTVRFSEDVFSELWFIHPYGSKKDAREAYRKARGNGAPPDSDLIVILKRQVQERKDADASGEFCARLPHLCRWFTHHRWEDAPMHSAAEQPPTPRPEPTKEQYDALRKIL